VVAQFVLPGIAEDRVRDDLNDHGVVREVSVSSFPAVKLLWGSADEVTAEMESFEVTEQELADLAEDGEGAGEVELRTERGRIGRAPFGEAVLRQDGEDLRATLLLSERDIATALPPGSDARVRGAGEDSVTLEASAGVFGLDVARREITVAARDGAITAQPSGGIVGSIVGGVASVTVFREPRIRVDRVGGRTTGGGVRAEVRATLAG
jgi:hypothetical protein